MTRPKPRTVRPPDFYIVWNQHHKQLLYPQIHWTLQQARKAAKLDKNLDEYGYEHVGIYRVSQRRVK